MRRQLNSDRWRRIALPVLAILSTAEARADAAKDVSALLFRQTEEFSAASSQGDRTVMERLLDDRVVFFNEGGDSASKKDMIASAQPPAAGVQVSQKITDWHCEQHGDVAVASFIDDQLAVAAGVPTRARFQSVETWLRSRDRWLMIGSETIALQDDPVSAELPIETLKEYAGTYVNSTGIRFVFAVTGRDLTASINGGPTTVQKAEVRDVVFTPGRARFRKVFQRDGNGRVMSFAYRREGHDTVFTRVG